MIRVSEIFGPTVQGEGAQIGRPTVFVRTGGCDYRCTWCDTLYAVDPVHRPTWTPMLPEAIMARVATLSGDTPCLVTLSGGNPALQPLEPLLVLGHERGYTFTMETQGSVARPWFQQLDHLCLSPKPPSSGNVTSIEDVARVLNVGAPMDTVLKVVVFDALDFGYAIQMANAFPRLRMFLQVGNATPVGEGMSVNDLLNRYQELMQATLAAHRFDFTVLPQLHTLLWGNTRGV